MGTAEEVTLFNILIVGILGMFGLALAIVFFFLTYQRRLLKQQQARQEAEVRYQQELLRATLKSQEQERRRIGGDLHDEVGALISTSRLYLGQLSPDLGAEKQEELQSKIRELSDELLRSVRRISHDLKPSVLDKLGLEAALESMADRINDSEELAVALDIHLPSRLDAEKEMALYRISQELLQNTLKHAGAGNIFIQIKLDNTYIQYGYQDDGKGFDGQGSAEGLGLKNIESRAKSLGGTLSYEKVPRGMSLRIHIPHAASQR